MRGCHEQALKPLCPLACRRLIALAQSTTDLAPTLSHAIRSGSGTGVWLAQQALAGCLALEAVQLLAEWLPQLSSQAAFKLGAACSMAFGPGAAVAERLASQQPTERLMLDARTKGSLFVCQLTIVSVRWFAMCWSLRKNRGRQPPLKPAPAGQRRWFFAMCRAVPSAAGLPGEHLIACTALLQ